MGKEYTRESIRDRVVEWEVMILQVFNKSSIVNLKMISPIPYVGPFRIRMSVPLTSIQSIDSPVMDSGVEKIRRQQ
jgi:hypothetical protein